MSESKSHPDLSKLSIKSKAPSGSAFSLYARLGFIAAIGVALLAALGFFFFIGNEGSDKEATPPKAAPQTAKISYPPQTIERVFNATGYVVAQRSAAVSSKATGRLRELNIKEGDLVKQGQVLGVLENDDVKADVQQAEATVRVSRANELTAQAEYEDALVGLQRLRELRKGQYSSQSQIDTAQARFNKALSQVQASKAQTALSEAQLSKAQTELEYTLIRAPFDGTVLKKNSEIGEIVAPFGSSTNARAAIATIADMKSLQVEADVSESNLSKVYVSQSCTIKLDSVPDRAYQGMVDKIVPTVDRAKATVLTKIRFSDIDEKVIPEMSAKVACKLKE